MALSWKSWEGNPLLKKQIIPGEKEGENLTLHPAWRERNAAFPISRETKVGGVKFNFLFSRGGLQTAESTEGTLLKGRKDNVANVETGKRENQGRSDE